MHAVNGTFVSLADALRPRPPSSAVTPEVELPPASPPPPPLPASKVPILPAHVAGDDREHAAAIRAARLFGAALSDAFDRAVADLVRELAVDILARELRLADVDVAAIARRLITERRTEEPLSLRVAPEDAATVCELPVVIDDALEPGDAILECRSGSIDARLGVRLAALLGSTR